MLQTLDNLARRACAIVGGDLTGSPFPLVVNDEPGNQSCPVGQHDAGETADECTSHFLERRLPNAERRLPNAERRLPVPRARRPVP
jgi:hypothetical protein